jgi:CDP-glucose 4,6-dehydratase
MEAVGMSAFNDFRGKRVLVTGHTGFKGGWLSIWLHQLGADLAGVALDPEDPRGVFAATGIGDRMRDHRMDIRDAEALYALFAAERPEVVFHMAARPLVLESYRTPVEAFAVNTLGTVHVLEAVRRTPSVRALVCVTSDKCYENVERHRGYAEEDPLGGHDPYSASKGAAEIAIAAYRRSFFHAPGAPGVASARAGNVIGGGDRAADRLVPDLVRAFEHAMPLHVRRPDSVRPWQHVLEPLHGYLTLAQGLLRDPVRFGGAWNFGPQEHEARTVRELADALGRHFGSVVWVDASSPDQPHEAGLLRLDIGKAERELGWRPRLSFAETVSLTAEWYQREQDGEAMALCQHQIDTYLRHGDR